jgi:hypothetical protein
MSMLVHTEIPLTQEIDSFAGPTAQQMAMVLQMHRGQHQLNVIAAATGLRESQVGNIIRAAKQPPKKRPAMRRR